MNMKKFETKLTVFSNMFDEEVLSNSEFDVMDRDIYISAEDNTGVYNFYACMDNQCNIKSIGMYGEPNFDTREFSVKVDFEEEDMPEFLATPIGARVSDFIKQHYTNKFGGASNV